MCLNHDCSAQRGATPSRPSTVAEGDAGLGAQGAMCGQEKNAIGVGEGQEGMGKKNREIEGNM